MSKELVEKVVNTDKGVDTLEELISSIPDIPTAELVTGFRMANTYSKRIEKFVNAVKKELVNNADLTGRFFEEGVEVDEKGHRYLRGVDNDELKAEKRVYVKFNEEKAKELLEKKGLLDLGSEENLTCSNLNQLYDLLVSLENQVDLSALATVKAMKDLFTVERTVTEARVEALVALGKIDTEEVKDLMDVTIQYAVKEVKRKK